MQVHNFAARQTIFAFNNWKAGPAADLGIGNSDPGANKPRYSTWTFNSNASQYVAKQLKVLVHSRWRRKPTNRGGWCSSTSTPDLKSLFLQALEQQPGLGDPAYLDGVCRGDGQLRGRIDELIEYYLRASGGRAAAATDLAAGVRS